MGIMGITLIVTGSYCLNISSVKGGLFEPVRAVFREQGSWLMLLVSFIYSITSVLGKIGVMNSNPYFFGSSYFIVLSLAITVLIPISPGTSIKRLTAKPLKGIMLGAIYSIMVFSHMLAISQVEAAYMVSVKRLSLLIGIFYGAWWFREERIGERLFGAIIMLAGVFLIGFFS